MGYLKVFYFGGQPRFPFWSLFQLYPLFQGGCQVLPNFQGAPVPTGVSGEPLREAHKGRFPLE
jgi:hypothetical protein